MERWLFSVLVFPVIILISFTDWNMIRWISTTAFILKFLHLNSPIIIGRLLLRKLMIVIVRFLKSQVWTLHKYNFFYVVMIDYCSKNRMSNRFFGITKVNELRSDHTLFQLSNKQVIVKYGNIKKLFKFHFYEKNLFDVWYFHIRKMYILLKMSRKYVSEETDWYLGYSQFHIIQYIVY